MEKLIKKKVLQFIKNKAKIYTNKYKNVSIVEDRDSIEIKDNLNNIEIINII